MSDIYHHDHRRAATLADHNLSGAISGHDRRCARSTGYRQFLVRECHFLSTESSDQFGCDKLIVRGNERSMVM